VTDTPALRALADLDVPHRVIRFERPRSVQESAARQGIEVASLIKTIVVRRGEDDYVFVLVPGDRAIDWSSLRSHLGVRRLSLPDADEAQAATGYERGTITPFGATRAWPVIADGSIDPDGEVSIGGGAHGVAVRMAAADVLRVLGAERAAVTKPVDGDG
jgi:Cys-tRNA(Pro)/Cys-tRNA(Cys) deacylase